MDYDQGDEDRELLNIEDNSQKLEGLYKEMEHTRREILLFEAYLLRNGSNANQDEEQEERRGKKSKKDKNQEKQYLTCDEKYEIANLEAEALKKNIEDGRTKSDGILETLRAILEETDMAITEIRKDAFEFQREILIGGENSRTGKIEAEKVIKYREEKLRQKDQLIEKYKAKKATLESQIFKTQNQIHRKDEMGDDLKFIDFHQLQIEYKKYVKEINEKNDKLLNLKVSTAKIITKLTNERQKLVRLIQQAKTLQDNIDYIKKNIEKTQVDIRESALMKEQEYNLYKRFLQQHEKIKLKPNSTVPEVFQYARLKKEQQQLEYEIKNLQRKKDIQKSAYRQAIKFIQSNQQ